MQNQYDVIVVGAGNAGMMAAATTAKAGLKTLLLEKHNLPGGCATSFVRGRFEFEPSLHELCNIGTPQTPGSIAYMLDQVGAKVDWRYEHNIFRAIVKGENGYDVTLKAGEEAFIASMEEAVPGSAASVRAFLDLVGPLDAAQEFMDKEGVKFVKLFRDYGDFLRAGSHSTEEVMTALGMPKKAQDLINTYWGYLGAPTDDLNALHFLYMVSAYIKYGAGMPHLRSHEISLSLIHALQSHGGEVRYNSEVTRFLFNEKGEACGVEANGETFYAKEIISNVIPNNVFNRSDEKHITAHSRKLANARRFGISVATIYLGLDCTAEELGVDDYTVFVMADSSPRRQYELRGDKGMYIVNCLNTVIPDSSPAGTCTLFFTTLMFGSDLPVDLKPEEYKKFKNKLAKEYIEDYEKLMGISILPHIEEIEVATPVTFARYLGTPDGTIYGYMTQGWDNIIARTATKDADYDIPHLHFCGGHYIRGDGYSTAYLTGDMVANDVIKALKEGTKA